MIKINKKSTILCLIIFILVAISNIGYGNSAEPPSILIIVPNAPEDLEISIGTGETLTKAKEIKNIIETHYIFYLREVERASEYKFNISAADIKFHISLEESLEKYNNIYTLNIGDKTFTQGKLLSRSILLVSMRIVLTLIIEGAIFWQFGFREKVSWVVFIILNLITQGILNIWINSFSPMVGYLFFSLIFAEIIIVIVEILSFLVFVKEHSKFEKISYVLAANIISLFLGGYIITKLPI